MLICFRLVLRKGDSPISMPFMGINWVALTLPSISEETAAKNRQPHSFYHTHKTHYIGTLRHPKAGSEEPPPAHLPKADLLIVGPFVVSQVSLGFWVPKAKVFLFSTFHPQIPSGFLSEPPFSPFCIVLPPFGVGCVSSNCVSQICWCSLCFPVRTVPLGFPFGFTRYLPSLFVGGSPKNLLVLSRQ